MMKMVKGIRRFLWLCMGMAAMLFAGGCSDKAVSVVKKGHFSGYPDVTIGAICKLRFNSGKWSSENESGRTCVYFRGKISKATREMLVERSIKSYSEMVDSAISRYIESLVRGIDPYPYLKLVSSENLREIPEWKTIQEMETKFLSKKEEMDGAVREQYELSRRSYTLPDGVAEQYEKIRSEIRRYKDEYTRESYLRARRGEWNYSENKPDPDADKYMTEAEKNKNLAIWRTKLAELDKVYSKQEDEFIRKRDKQVKQLEEKLEILKKEYLTLEYKLPDAFKPLKQYLLGPQFWQVGSEVVFKWTVFPNGKTYRLDAYQNSTLGYYSFSHFMDIICKQ